MSLGRFPERYLSAAVPGWWMGRSLGGRALGDVVVLGTALSILSLVLFEYVALTRLLPAMAVRVRPRQAELGVGAVFVAAAAVSLAAPDAACEKLVTPCLVALYLSEAVVFAVYPRFRQRQGKLNAVDLVVSVAALALMLYGLYMAIKTSSGI